MAQTGQPPVVITQRGDPEAFNGISEAVVRLNFPSLGRVVREAKKHGATRVVMAGYIAKKHIFFLPALLDPLTLKTLAQSARDDHSLLSSIVAAFEGEGLTVSPYWQMMPELLAQEGCMSARAPTKEEARDVQYGAEVLKVTLPCSFGQALVVTKGAVVAIEALEGTDAMIERAGALVGRGVLVKMMRADQDSRYDLPTVGPRTIENMARAGLSCLAVEAQRTLILEPQKTLALADEKRIAVWGLSGFASPLPCPSL